MIEMDCPHCKMLLRIPEQYKGESGKCNHCGSPITAQILSSSSDQKLKSENAVDEESGSNLSLDQNISEESQSQISEDAKWLVGVSLTIVLFFCIYCDSHP